MTRSYVNFQDLLINLDEVTDLSDSSLFDTNQLPWRAYEYDPSTVTVVTLEMNLDLHIVERNLVTILDFLANIGGLDSIFTSVISLVFTIWHSHGLADIFLVTQLFTLPSVMGVAH